MSYKRKREDNKRLYKTYIATYSNYGAGVYYSNTKKLLIKYTKKPNIKREYKKQANHRARQYKNIPNNSGDKRVYDLWWELW